MSMPTNDYRARRVEIALIAFDQIENSGAVSIDPEAILVDLLTDLQHWADARGIDFSEALEWAEEHHLSENEVVEAAELIVWRDPRGDDPELPWA